MWWRGLGRWVDRRCRFGKVGWCVTGKVTMAGVSMWQDVLRRDGM